jgi:hypothetical protein
MKIKMRFKLSASYHDLSVMVLRGYHYSQVTTRERLISLHELIVRI